jgi:hypothetical protein
MAYSCAKCRKPVQISNLAQVGRAETCDHCGADLHCCINCKHFDQSAYNYCREPQAERVLEKDRSNFCDYFSYKEGSGGAKAGSDQKDYLKSLDQLFKK